MSSLKTTLLDLTNAVARRLVAALTELLSACYYTMPDYRQGLD